MGKGWQAWLTARKIRSDVDRRGEEKKKGLGTPRIFNPTIAWLWRGGDRAIWWMQSPGSVSMRCKVKHGARVSSAKLAQGWRGRGSSWGAHCWVRSPESRCSLLNEVTMTKWVALSCVGSIGWCWPSSNPNLAQRPMRPIKITCVHRVRVIEYGMNIIA